MQPRYAQLVLQFVTDEVDTQIQAMREGLATIIPLRTLLGLRWDELETFVCGEPKVNIKLLKRAAVYKGR